MNTTYNTLLPNSLFAKKLTDSHYLFLQKVKYWTEKCGRTIQGEQGTWIYNSLSEWEKQFPQWSRSKLRRVINFLEKANLIFTKKPNAKKWNHTKWYSINLEKFYRFFKKPVHSDNKSTNRCVQNEQIINIQKTNYTSNKNSLSLYPSLSSEKSIEKIEEENEKEKIKKGKKEKILKQKQSHTNKQILEAKNIARNMTECWNKVFADSQNKIKAYSNKNLIFKLQNLYETKFKQDLKEWESYAQKVASSKFLMGEKKETFKASFAWLLKGEIVDSILNGAYGVGDRTTKALVDTNIQEMVEIWNSKMANETPVVMTRKRAGRLKSVFKKHFSSKLEEWEEFVDLIKESEFLMGGKTAFKISLDFAIAEERLLKIKEGDYHSRDEWSKIVANREQKQVVSGMQNDTKLDPRWKNTLKKMTELFGIPTYISWFSKLKFESEEEGILRLQTRSAFVSSYIETHYLRKMLDVASGYFGDLKKIYLSQATQEVVL